MPDGTDSPVWSPTRFPEGGGSDHQKSRHGDYSLLATAQLSADLPLYLHHCADDDVVPLTTWTVMQPGAARLLGRPETGGHKFEGQMAAVAGDVAATGA